MLARAPELSVVAVVDAITFWLDEHGRLLIGEEQPVAVPLPQPAPRPVDVDAEAGDDAAQIGTLPGTGPGSDRALADAQRRVRDEERLGDVVHDTQTMTARAGTGHGIGREGLGREWFGPGGVVACSRVEHPQQVGERGDGADRRAGGGRPAALLKGDRGRQSGDLLDMRCTDLLQQPARIRRHRLEVAALRLRVQGAEGQRRLARAGDSGERDQGVPGDVDVDVAEVVLVGAADAHEVVGRVDGHTSLVPGRGMRTPRSALRRRLTPPIHVAALEGRDPLTRRKPSRVDRRQNNGGPGPAGRPIRRRQALVARCRLSLVSGSATS